MEAALKYQLLSDLINSLEAEGYALGTGKHLQLQLLLDSLPEDAPLSDLKTLLVPIFATNYQEQAHFYELFDKSLARVEQLNATSKPVVGSTLPKRRNWWRNISGLLLLTLLSFIVYLIWEANRPPEEPNPPIVYGVTVNRLDTAIIFPFLEVEDTLKTLSFCDGTYLQVDSIYGIAFIDSLQRFFFIAEDTIGTLPDSLCVQAIFSTHIDTAFYQVAIVDGDTLLPPPPLAKLEPLAVPYPHNIAELAVDPNIMSKALFYDQNGWWIKTLLVALIGLLLWTIIQWRAENRRDLVAEIESKESPPYVWNVELGESQNIYFNQPFQLVLNQLRKRTRDEAFRLDVEETISATIESGGFIDFKYRQQTRPPEYLLLIERQHPNDHRAMLFDALFEAFHANELLVERFFFNGDIRTCYNETYPYGIGIQDLAHQYRQSRLFIISSGHRLLSPMSGKLSRWTQIFSTWKERALLSPRPIASWGRKERQLDELFELMPASLGGILQVLEQWDTLEDRSQEELLQKIEDAPKEPIVVSGTLIPSLQQYYSEEMIQWIAACAVYPAIHWDLTLFLGGTLSEGKRPLLSLDNLIALNRLPWFVEGKIPEAARMELLIYLEENGLDSSVRAVIDEALQKAPKPNSDSVAFEDFRMNVVVNELLLTKDKQKRKELEEELGRYMSAGKEPDFVVFKYLERPRNQFDFIVPESWKKYVYHEGQPFFGLKDWPWATGLWLLLSALIISYQPQFDICVEGREVFYAKPQPETEYPSLGKEGEEVHLCLKDERDELLFLEVEAIDLVREEEPEAANDRVNFFLEENPDLQDTPMPIMDTIFLNLAYENYNRGVFIFNELLEPDPSFPGSFSTDNSYLESCIYFDYANLYISLIKDSTLTFDPAITLQQSDCAFRSGSGSGINIPNNLIVLQPDQTRYSSIELNGLSWLAQNLNIPIPGSSWAYRNDEKLRLKGGLLYTWQGAQDACEKMGFGWRVPSDKEWQDMLLSVGGYLDFTKRLNRGDPNASFKALMEGEFKAMEAGFRDEIGDFYDRGAIGSYWSSSASSQTNAWNINFSQDAKGNGNILRVASPKAMAFSCRCVKDSPKPPGSTRSQTNVPIKPTKPGTSIPNTTQRTTAQQQEQTSDLGNEQAQLEQTTAEPEVQIVEQNGYTGLVTADGKTIVEPIYVNIEKDPATGLYRVQKSEGKQILLGYINKEGKVVIPIEYGELGFLHDGLIRADQGLIGYLDQSGTTVIDFQYESATDFKGGLATVGKRIGRTFYSYTIDTRGICQKDCPEGVPSATRKF